MLKIVSRSVALVSRKGATVQSLAEVLIVRVQTQILSFEGRWHSVCRPAGQKNVNKKQSISRGILKSNQCTTQVPMSPTALLKTKHQYSNSNTQS